MTSSKALKILADFHEVMDQWYDGPESHAPSDLVKVWMRAKTLLEEEPAPPVPIGGDERADIEAVRHALGHLPPGWPPRLQAQEALTRLLAVRPKGSP